MLAMLMHFGHVCLNKEVLNRSVETSKCGRTFVKSMVDIEKHTLESGVLANLIIGMLISARTGGRNTNNL